MEPATVEVKKILCATDLSDSARHAFAYAVSLAELYGARIVFLHVVPKVSRYLDAHIIGYVSEQRNTRDGIAGGCHDRLHSPAGGPPFEKTGSRGPSAGVSRL